MKVYFSTKNTKLIMKKRTILFFLFLGLGGIIGEILWIRQYKEISDTDKIRDRISTTLAKAKRTLTQATQNSPFHSSFSSKNTQLKALKKELKRLSKEKSSFNKIFLLDKQLKPILYSGEKIEFSENKSIFNSIKKDNKAELVILKNRLWIIVPINSEKKNKRFLIATIAFMSLPPIVFFTWERDKFAFWRVPSRIHNQIKTELTYSNSSTVNILSDKTRFIPKTINQYEIIAAASIATTPFYNFWSFRIIIAFIFTLIGIQLPLMITRKTKNQNFNEKDQSKNLENFPNLDPTFKIKSKENKNHNEMNYDTMKSFNTPSIDFSKKETNQLEKKVSKTQFLHLPFDQTFEYNKTRIQKIARNRVFTKEAQKLISEITKPSSDWEKLKTLARNKEKLSWNSLIEKTYLKKSPNEQVEFLITTLMTEASCNAMALMFFNPFLGAYKITTSIGLNNDDIQKFYLLQNDPFIKLEENKFTVTKIDHSNKKDPFLIKRFSKETLEKTCGIWSISIHAHNFHGYLIAFYHEYKNFDNIDQALKKDLNHKLLDCTPAFNCFRENYEKTSIENLPRELIKEIKLITNDGLEQAKVVDIVFEEIFTKANFIQLKESMRKVLIKNERIIYNTPFHLIFLIQLTPLESIQAELEQFKHKLYYKVYPEAGKNLFKYTEFI